MVYRRHIYYWASQRADIWDRWQVGEPVSSIGRLFDREPSLICLQGVWLVGPLATVCTKTWL